MKKILVVTGTRAEYGLLRPVLRAVDEHPGLELQLLATGAHLEPRYGRTVEEIRREWRPDAEVPLELGDGSPAEIARAVGRATLGVADAVERLAPDVAVVLGDRFEILGAGVGALYAGAILAHIHGGDVSSAGYDEHARHALTKLAHLHFAASERSAERIRRMGEEAWRVFTVGAPGLDSILRAPLPDAGQLAARYRLSGAPLALLVQHPVSTRPQTAAEELRITLEALETFPHLQIIAVYPNADAGGGEMIEVYRGLPPRANLTVVPSLPHADFLGLLARAALLVGNSSSGILEAPSFRVAVVNIGTRQEGRERADNVLDAPHQVEAIRAAIRDALSDTAFRKRVAGCVSPYGDGRAGERIARILAETPLDARLRDKRLSYPI